MVSRRDWLDGWYRLPTLIFCGLPSKPLILPKCATRYTHLVRKLRVIGITLSDRRIVKAQKALAAAALLRGSLVAAADDLWPVVILVQDKDKQAEISDVLHSELSEARNPILTESVRKASYGPSAHAAYLVERGQTLLEGRPQLRSDPSFEVWLVRLETLKANIDASFSDEDCPQDLKVLKTALHAQLETEGQSQASPTESSVPSVRRGVDQQETA